MKESYEKSLGFVLKSEGGYTDHPLDKGGPTNKGITLDILRRFHPDATEDDLRNITAETVSEIYRAGYWNAIKGDDLPRGIDYAIFDAAVNHGPGTSIKMLQRACNRIGKSIAVDGVIGPVTIARTHSRASDGLLADLMAERDIYYRKIVATNPSQEVFLKGWLNRIAEVTKNAREMMEV